MKSSRESIAVLDAHISLRNAENPSSASSWVMTPSSSSSDKETISSFFSCFLLSAIFLNNRTSASAIRHHSRVEGSPDMNASLHAFSTRAASRLNSSTTFLQEGESFTWLPTISTALVNVSSPTTSTIRTPERALPQQRHPARSAMQNNFIMNGSLSTMRGKSTSSAVSPPYPLLRQE